MIHWTEGWDESFWYWVAGTVAVLIVFILVCRHFVP